MQQGISRDGHDADDNDARGVRYIRRLGANEGANEAAMQGGHRVTAGGMVELRIGR